MSNESRAKLKPCPFCGGNAHEPEKTNPGKGRPIWQIGCTTMYCFHVVSSSKKEVTELWNTRAPEQAMQSKIDSLRAENERLKATFENESLKGDSHVTAADSYYEIAEILDVSDGGSVIETAQGIKEELDILRAALARAVNDVETFCDQGDEPQWTDQARAALISNVRGK